MPKQVGMFPIAGKIQGLDFYETEAYGPLVKRSGGPSREQVLHGDNYAYTRLNNEEFGRGSKYGALIRKGLRSLLTYCQEAETHNNLSNRIRDIMKTDKESKWGSRDLRRDTLVELRHFELDSRYLSTQYFELPVETHVGNGELGIAAGITFKRKPHGIDAWKLISVAASVDLVTKQETNDVQKSDLYELEKGSFGVGFNHTYDEDRLLFHGMCIVFYKYDAVIDDYRELKRRERVNAGFLRYVQV
jgi:hypothetical protein